ncbi:MAG: CoA transferase, partial [Dehalococcoidales bacterium]
LRRAQGTSIGEINQIMQVLNRNKKGLALDLKKEPGQKIIHRMIKDTDVFMSNYELSSMGKLGLDYETLRAINPRLIYAVITGYGKVGPDKDQRGYDFAAGWARSGMMHLIGEPGSPPAPPRAGMIDSMAGAHLTAGVLAALLNREKTGKGQELEVSLYHAGVWDLAMDIQGALAGNPMMKFDRTKAGNPIWNSYRAKDETWFWLAMLQSDPSWPDVCRAIDRPELETDPRFNSLDARMENNEELIRILDEIMATRTGDEWEQAFRRENVIYGRVASPEEVVNDPQAIENNFFAEVDHPLRKIKLVTTPVNFTQNPAVFKEPAPEVGQHTEEIILELGYSWEDIASLKEQGVIL